MLRKRLMALTLAAVLATSNAGSITAYASNEVSEYSLNLEQSDDMLEETIEYANGEQEDDATTLDSAVEGEPEISEDYSESASEDDSDVQPEEAESASSTDSTEEDAATEFASDLDKKDDNAVDKQKSEEYSALEVYQMFQSMDYVDEGGMSLFSTENEIAQATVNRFEVWWLNHDNIDLLDSSISDGEGLEYKTLVDFSGYNGKTALNFIIGFDHPSAVSSVEVVGIIDGEEYSLQAERNGSSNIFNASGFFLKGNDCSGLSSISLKIRSNRVISKVSKNNSTVNVNDEVVARYKRFNEMLGNVSVSTEDGAQKISVAYDEFYEPTKKKIAKEALEVLIEEVSPETIAIKDIVKSGAHLKCDTDSDDGGNYQIYFDTSDPKNMVGYFVDGAEPASKITKYVVSLQDEQNVYNSLTEFSESFSQILKIGDAMSDYLDADSEYEDYIDQINNSSIKDKEAAKKSARQLRDSKQLYSMATNMIIPLVVACCDGLPGGVGIALLVSGAKALMDCSAEYLWEQRAKDILGTDVAVTNSNVYSKDGYYNLDSKELDGDGNVKQTAHIYGSMTSGFTLEIGGEDVSSDYLSSFADPDTGKCILSEFEYPDYVTKIVFSPGVKKAYFDWRKFPQLEEIILPNGLVELNGGGYAPNVKNIRFPASLKKIGKSTFVRSGLESITFGNHLEEIGDEAFENNPLKGTITIPASCTKIGKEAFNNCPNIEKMVINGNVEELNFPCGTSRLKEFVIKGDIDTLSGRVAADKIYILGHLNTKQGYGGLMYDELYYGGKKEELLATGLNLYSGKHFFEYNYETGEKKAAFSGMCGEKLTYKLYDISGSSSALYDLHITGTGKMYDYDGNSNKAPWSEYSLNDVYLYNGITRIGNNACLKGKFNEIPSTVESIGNYAFSESSYSGILMIPGSVVEIGTGAFEYSLIKNVYIGKGLTRIPDNCFKGCSKFSGRLIIPENITEIGKNAFESIGWESENVTLEVRGKNLLKVGDRAFLSNKGLKFQNVAFISNLSNIGCLAFGNCKLQGDIAFTNLQSIDIYAFENCTGITSVSFANGPETVTGFDGCTDIKSVRLLSGVKKIGSSAFKNCTDLSELELCDGITRINDKAFKNCINLAGNLVIPSSVEYISTEAFYNCQKLTSLKLNEGNYSIGDRAFKNCTGFKGDLIIPKSLGKLGKEAFKNCTGFDGSLVFETGSNGHSKGLILSYGVFENCSNITGTVAIGGGNVFTPKEQWQRVFLGMDKVEEFVLSGNNWPNLSKCFVSNGQTGNYLGDDEDEWSEEDDEVEYSDAIVDISTFPANAKLICAHETAYNAVKDLGYETVDASAEYKGYRLLYETNGHGRSSWTASDQMVIPQSLPELTENGYTFGGWYTDSDCKEEDKAVPGTKLSKDLKIYAKWTANSYSVTFDAGKGKLAEGTASTKAVTFGQPYGDLPIAASDDEDETFIGWYTAAVDGTQVNAESAVAIASDHTLYAVYKAGGKLTAPYVTDADGNRYESGKELQAGTKLYLRSDDHNVSFYYVTSDAAVKEIPEDDAHLYKGAIELKETTTISVKAVKENYKSSNIEAYTFMLKDSKKDFGELVDADREALLKDNKNADDIPAGLWAAGYDEEVDYTGSAITFDDTLHVYYGKKLLESGDDYTVKYANNLKAYNSKTKATITITGKGNYTGSKKIEFVINPLKLDDGNGKNRDNLKIADAHVQYTGKVIKPTTTITYVYDDGKEVVLKKGTDFTYDYSEVGAEAPEQGYVVKVVGKGNYTGTATFREYVFKQDEKINISKMTFKAIPAETADGKEKMPEIFITDKTSAPEYKQTSYELVKGKDFTVEYFNNKVAGTATAVVTGLDKYAGTKTLTFKINGIAISKAKFDIKPVTYNGAAQTPSYTLTYQANKTAAVETLTDKGENPDFTVSISNNIKKGTGTITFTGINRFTGTVKKTFKINGLAIYDGAVTVICRDKSSSAATADLGTFNYTKGGVKPELTLNFNGEEMVLNRDYKVKYANNNSVGGTGNKEPKLTITGAGNFAGTLTRTFTITGASLADTTVTATDIQASTKAGTCKPAIAVYDTNGVKLAAGKDYDSKNIVYTYVSETDIQRKQGKKFEAYKAAAGENVDVKNDIIPVGTDIKVTLYGAGFYDKNSSNEAVFTYVDNLISKATVKLNNSAYEYTGSHIELSESDLKVTIGKETVPAGAYRITSITQNTQKGTAKLTIEGVGKVNGKYYGGSKTVTFKINARKIN